MKQLIFIVCMALAVGCNNSDDKTAGSSSDSTKMSGTKTDDLVYPYTLSEPYRDWQPGDKRHAVTVMQSLKAFENGDIAGSMAGFGDTVDIRFDQYRARLSHDSLAKVFQAFRNEVKDIEIKMDDWESVISKDGKVEYVTLWYRQISTDKNGKIDSVAVVDDAKIVNGKIVELDEKIQRYPPKK